MGGRLLQFDYESIVWLSAFLVMAIFCGNLVKSFCPFIEVSRCVIMNYYEFLQLFFTYRSMQS